MLKEESLTLENQFPFLFENRIINKFVTSLPSPVAGLVMPVGGFMLSPFSYRAAVPLGELLVLRFVGFKNSNQGEEGNALKVAIGVISSLTAVFLCSSLCNPTPCYPETFSAG